MKIFSLTISPATITNSSIFVNYSDLKIQSQLKYLSSIWIQLISLLDFCEKALGDSFNELIELFEILYDAFLKN